MEMEVEMEGGGKVHCGQEGIASMNESGRESIPTHTTPQLMNVTIPVPRLVSTQKGGRKGRASERLDEMAEATER